MDGRDGDTWGRPYTAADEDEGDGGHRWPRREREEDKKGEKIEKDGGFLLCGG